MLGTASGHIQVHDPDGRLLLRQRLHDSAPVKSIRGTYLDFGPHILLIYKIALYQSHPVCAV